MRVGDIIGSYRIETVGATSCGAMHAITGAQVRLRWVSPVGDPAAFVQTARRLCGVTAPSLHGLIDVGIDGERCYLADEPLVGESLESHMARIGPLKGEAGLAFAESIFGALIEMHGRDVRDGALTPERVRVVGDQARITEPGLGRLLSSLAPDPRFAAPGAGAAPSVADDLYAAAAIVCFALNGRSLPPHEAAAATGAPQPIVELLTACLAESPADRPDSADVPRRTVEAVRAGTLSGTPVEEAQPPASGWFTDGSVDATAGDSFDYSQVPDELPSAQHAVVSAPAPAPSATPTQAARPPELARRPAPPPAPPPKPAVSTNTAILLLLLVIAGGAAAFFMLRPERADLPRPTPDPEPSAPASTAPASAVTPTSAESAGSAASAASVASAAPATLGRYERVIVQVSPGPARFVQVKSGTVLCESETTCTVPIDHETRVEKDGYEPTTLSGDDLYDRRGHRWKVRLYEKGSKKKRRK